MSTAQERSAVSRRFAKYSNNLAAAFQVLVDNNVAGAKEASKLLPPSHKSLQQNVVQELKEALDNFTPGFLSEEDHISSCLLLDQSIQTRENNREYFRSMVEFEQNLDAPPPRLLTVVSSNLLPSGGAFLRDSHDSSLAVRPSLTSSSPFSETSKYLVRHRHHTVAFDPMSKQAYGHPLLFKGEVNIDIMEDKIKYWPCTNIIDIKASWLEILITASKYGMDYDHLATLMKSYVNKFHNEHYFTCSSLTNYKVIFDRILDLLETSSICSRLENQLNSLVREPTDTISSIFFRHRALTSVKLRYLEPGLTEEENLRKSTRLSKDSLIYYITPACAQQLRKFRDEAYSYGEQLSAEDIIREIDSLEYYDESLKPTTPLEPTETKALTFVSNTKDSAPTYWDRPSTRPRNRYSSDFRQETRKEATKKRRQLFRSPEQSPIRPPGPRQQSRSPHRSRDRRDHRNRSRSPGPRSSPRPRSQSPYERRRSQDTPRSRRESDRNSYRSDRSQPRSRSNTPDRRPYRQTPSSSSSHNQQYRQSSRSPGRYSRDQNRSDQRQSRYDRSRSRSLDASALQSEIERLQSKLQKYSISTCAKCGRSGHFHRDCRVIPGDVTPSVCTNCNKLWHQPQYCPEKNNN